MLLWKLHKCTDMGQKNNFRRAGINFVLSHDKKSFLRFFLPKLNRVNYVIRSTPPSVCRHFENCVRQFSKTSWWKSSFIGLEFSTSIIIGCNYVNNAAALSRCLILWKILCACHLPYPKEYKNNLSSLPLFMFHEKIRKKENFGNKNGLEYLKNVN